MTWLVLAVLGGLALLGAPVFALMGAQPATLTAGLTFATTRIADVVVEPPSLSVTVRETV